MNNTDNTKFLKWHCEYDYKLNEDGEIDIESVPKLSIQQSEFEKHHYKKGWVDSDEYFYKLTNEQDEDNIYYEFELMDTKEEMIEYLIKTNKDGISSYKNNITFCINQITELGQQIKELESM